MRVLGIDYGAKRIGLALGDTGTRIASAVDVLSNQELAQTIADLKAIIQQEGVSKAVVGVPRPLGDASLENAQVKKIRAFIAALRDAGIDVEESNEVLSSRVAAQQEQAGRALTAAGRAKKTGEKRDDLAAAAILQNWLDAQR